MKKSTYRFLNIVYGGLSGLLTGVVMMQLWIDNHMMPAMLYMLIFDQMEVTHFISGAFSIPGLLLLKIAHYVTAILFGVVFSLVLHRLVKSIWNGLGLGFMFGIVWWILTPFYLLPFFFVVSPNAVWRDLTMYELLDSLISHIVFGLILGLFYALFCMLLRRQARRG
jgi:hypothetical protein